MVSNIVPHAHYSQIFTFRLDFSPELWTPMSNCPLSISTQMTNIKSQTQNHPKQISQHALPGLLYPQFSPVNGNLILPVSPKSLESSLTPLYLTSHIQSTRKCCWLYLPCVPRIWPLLAPFPIPCYRPGLSQWFSSLCSVSTYAHFTLSST